MHRKQRRIGKNDAVRPFFRSTFPYQGVSVIISESAVLAVDLHCNTIMGHP